MPDEKGDAGCRVLMIAGCMTTDQVILHQHFLDNEQTSYTTNVSLVL